MAISDELNDLQTYLANAYTKLGLKGATIPQNKNMYNLEACVDSITPYAPPVIPLDAGTLTSISVTSNPTKTTYNEGEALDLTGVVITALYSGGATYNVTQGCSFTCNNPVTPSDTQITVNYGGQTASIPITVIALPIPAPASTTILCHFNGNKINEVTGQPLTNPNYSLANVGKFAQGHKIETSGSTPAFYFTLNRTAGATFEFWAKKENLIDRAFNITFNIGSSSYVLFGTSDIITTSGYRLAYVGSAQIFSSQTVVTIPQAITATEFHHYAYVFDTNQFRFYRDGVLMTTGNYGNFGTSFRINNIEFFGVMDELLVCNTAKYSSNFTPPQAPYYIQSNT